MRTAGCGLPLRNFLRDADGTLRRNPRSCLVPRVERPHNQQCQADGHGQCQRNQAVEKYEVGTLRGFVAVRVLPAGPVDYSYLRASTGSNCAARVAGTVPKTTPTMVAAASAITTESHGVGN